MQVYTSNYSNTKIYTMFVAASKKGSSFLNGLILFAVVVAAAVVALSLVKIVRDPKNAEGYRNTLGLGKKK